LTVITWFDSCTEAAQCSELGGKNLSLAVMTAAGLPVPPGFALTATAFRRTLGESGVGARLADVVSGVDPDSSASVSAAGAAAREAVENVEIGADLLAEIGAAYAELSARCGTENVPVAVRSSATCEDQPDASFAGEHDTYLWIRGVDAVVEHIRRCWASLFTDRAIAYRRRMGYPEEGAAMSVGIQKMVLPRTSGVAFTLNPTNGDRSQVAIDAAWGLGEAVVSGSVTPDNFLVDKVMGDITSRVISPKHIEHRLGDDDSVIEAAVEPARRDAPCLSDAEIRAVAALARRAERHYRCPQDVEWALDSQLPEGENVLLLQSRPETVWSRKRRPINGASTDTYQSIVHNLLHPAGSTRIDTHSH
jgi:pyruvate, water dikinase